MGLSRFLRIPVFALSLGLMVGCGSSHDSATSSSIHEDQFLKIQKTILQPKCVKCHSSSQRGGNIDLSSYRAVIESRTVVPGDCAQSKLWVSVKSGSMPRGAAPLTAIELKLLDDWITAGAKERDSEVSPAVAPANQATFSSLSQSVFLPKCVVCHNAAKPRGKVDLSSYDGLMKSTGKDFKPVSVSDVEKSGLVVEIVEQKMPPTPKVWTAEELKALKDWIALGAPEVTPGIILPGPGEPPGPPQPTYEWISKNLLSRRCGSCHGEPFKVGGIDMTSYATLVASTGKMMKALVPGDPSASGIHETIVAKQMPPPRKGVTTDEVELIKTWIKGGAKND